MLAETIRAAKAAELESVSSNVDLNLAAKILVVEWMQAFVDEYTLGDKRNMQGALDRFKDMIASKNIKNLTFSQLDAVLLEDFQRYLESTSRGEGPSSYYNRFTKMIRRAQRKKILRVNVLGEVERKIKGKAAKKDTLTLEEMQKVIDTPVQSEIVRTAALFSFFTGLAWIDIKKLKWSEVKLNEKLIRKVRSKARVYNEIIEITLNQSALELLPLPQNPEDLVFTLPSADGANKTLKKWVKRAGIDKKITWHNLRHSFGTIVTKMTGNVVTASKLLGHGSLKHTIRYVDSDLESKRAATEMMNIPIAAK